MVLAGRSWKRLDGSFDKQPSIPETTGRLYRNLVGFTTTHAVWGGLIIFKPFECY
jgi:hypothetical protein